MIRVSIKKVKVNLMTEAAKHSSEYAWRMYGRWLLSMKAWVGAAATVSLFQVVYFIGGVFDAWESASFETVAAGLAATTILFMGTMFIRGQVRFWRSIWQLSLHIEMMAKAHMAALFHVTEEDSQ